MSNNQHHHNGRDYSFGTIPAIEAVGVEVAIAKVIGEPAFKAFMEMDVNELKKGAFDKEKMMKVGSTAIGLLTTKMDADDLIKVMTTVFKYVTCDGKRVEINSTFTGRNKDLWVVFYHALRFNFADFFPDSLSGSVLDK